MASSIDKRIGMFLELGADYAKEHEDSEITVACPLCLVEYSRANITELTREHIIPSKLGGRTQTLTCRKCNNTQGSGLDSHLINLLKALDAIDGKEAIRTSVSSGEGKITAELFLGAGTEDEPISIQIVGPASNMRAVQHLRDTMRKDSTLELKMNFSIIPERYIRASFRAAFLSVFKVEGYKYALSPGAEQVRNTLGTGTPILENVLMEAFPERDLGTDLLVMPTAFSDFGDYYIVVLRLRTKRTRYISVLLPGKRGGDWSNLEALHQHAPRLRLETTPYGWNSKLYIRFGENPLAKLQRGLHDRFTRASSPIAKSDL